MQEGGSIAFLLLLIKDCSIGNCSSNLYSDYLVLSVIITFFLA